MKLKTKGEVLRAIREAKEVVVAPRFGLNDTWIRITKVEALAFIGALPDHATPEEWEMYGGAFGDLAENGTLFLG